jgi:quercetin dioxygenase-like cupin family protein
MKRPVITRRRTLKTLLTAFAASAFGEKLAFGEEESAKPSKVTTLLRQVLPGKGDDEATMVTVEYAPSARSDPHRHPGPVFGYILEGSIEFQVEGSPLTTYKQGQVFYEPPGQIHLVSRNASATQPAKLLAFLIAKKGEPVRLPAK